MISGYKMISLKSPTIYDDIESNNYKALMLTDIVIDNIDKPNIYITDYSVDNGKYIFDVYDKTITIDDDNVVTIADGGKHLYENVVVIYCELDDGERYNTATILTNCFISNDVDGKSKILNIIKNKTSEGGYPTISISSGDTSVGLFYRDNKWTQYESNEDYTDIINVDIYNVNSTKIF